MTNSKSKTQARVMDSAQSFRSGTTAHSTAAKGGVVKTIVLPHEDLNRLGTDGQLLMQVLEQQKALFQDTVAGYQKDRSVRTQEFDLKQRDHEDKMNQLQFRLQKDKELNAQIAGDYFNYKHQIVEAKQRLEDQTALARVENEALKKQMDEIIEAENAEGTYQEDLYAKKTEQFASRLRKSSRKNETELNIIKVQYSQVQEEYLSKLKALEAEIKKINKRGKQFDTRRAIES